MTTLHETIIPTKRVRRITVLISGSGSNLQALLDASNTPSLPNSQITHVLSSRSNAYGLTRAKTHTPPIPTSVCALKTFQNRNPGSTREDYDCEVARQIIESKPDLVVLAGWMHILSDKFLRILNGEIPPPGAPALPPPKVDSLPSGTEAIPSMKNLSLDDKEKPTSSSQEGDRLEKKEVEGKEETKEANKKTVELPSPPPTQQFPIPIINLHPALPGAFDGANAIGRAFDAFNNGEIEHTGVMVHRVVAEVDRGEPLIVRKVEIKKGDKLEDLEGRIHEVEHQIIVEGAKMVLEELDKEGRP
ncbi:hypothetical protein I302_104131 [Kwoniella bestiolae CBS 10118]|uniref:phosphoribosylglycinamide formyltransferase 1 n=1 Tax=Kwoniella bestiolae CBS 10118 TaxID=1296100 RepID=A0A1B9GAD6_9TREE|nr:phosphoribosylglycinamide formyltransferase [Kwoniella bestiolae CBS 10118]OCF27989.1 phosphoribosylglycinamide formyltransferase [Kwoniella bestiolae CBS 10118]